MNNPSVSEVVWNWRESRSAAPREDHARRRKHAIIEFCAVLAVAALVRFVFHKDLMSIFILSVGCIVLVGGLFIPPIYYGFKRFGAVLAHVIGVGVTWLLLVPFFYIFFTIARLVNLIKGHDPMCRDLDPTATSYWVTHPGTPSREQYRKQY